MAKILLNLGCGMVPLYRPKGGGGDWHVVNHDRVKHSPHVDEEWDLNILPWPWADNSVAQIHAQAVLEHLDITLLESINECWRILKPGGRLSVKLPLWDSEEAHNDVTHRWFVGPDALNLFDPETQRGRRYAFYGASHWRILSSACAGSCLYGKMEALK